MKKEIQLGLCEEHKWMAYQNLELGIGDCKKCVQALIDKNASLIKIDKERNQEWARVNYENKQLRKFIANNLIKTIKLGR